MIFLSSLLFVSLAAAQVAVPPLKARVTDLTSTLSAQQQQELERVLADFERRKGGQVAVLMVPTTKPESIEQYAVRVEEAWKLGRKGVDDSVLLVVAKNDRRLRIEVGYGYEGALPDARAKRIIDDTIVPRFKQGDFYGGIRAGVDRILGAVQGEALPAPPAPAYERPQYLPRVNFDIFFFLVIVAFIAHGVLRAIFGKVVGAGLLGAAGGSLIWLYAGTLFLSIFVGLILFALSLLFKPVAGGRGSGWSSGSDWSSGGGSWSSSSGGGGFSGGGGSSGGGGASGGW